MDRQFGALSGVAIVLIVLNHAINFGINTPLQLGYPPLPDAVETALSMIQGLGVFGVPIFFFISGSFISFSARGDPPSLSRKFIFSSLRHIIWPYAIWSLISYVVVYFHYGDVYSPFQYLKNLLVGFPYHFVPLLIFYYLISPLLLWLLNRIGGIIILLIAVYQFFLMSYLNQTLLGITYPDWARFLVPPVISSTFAAWGVYFPLGLYYSRKSRTLKPVLMRMKWVFIFLTVLLYAAAYLRRFTQIEVPLAGEIVPLPFIFLVPLISRNAIPFVRQLEKLGRRTYGIYLMHIIVVDLVLWAVQVVIPGLFAYSLAIILLLFVTGLAIPYMTMESVAKTRLKRVYRYVFG